MQNEAGKEIALWRYQVIAPLLAPDGPRGTLKREITRLSKRTHDHPLRGAIRIGYGTIEEWLYFYRTRVALPWVAANLAGAWQPRASPVRRHPFRPSSTEGSGSNSG